MKTRYIYNMWPDFLKITLFSHKVVKIIKTHILCAISSHPHESRTVYEITWKNIVDPGKLQMTDNMRRKKFALCMLDN